MANQELGLRRQIARAKSRAEDELLAIPGVTAIDVDHKITAGERTGRLAIVVWVKKKKSYGDLDAAERIPAEIEGFPTDVVEGEFTPFPAAEAAPTAAASSVAEGSLDPPANPLIGGVSVGPCERQTTGTLGVVLRVDGVDVMLSCFHVLVPAPERENTPVTQPGLPLGGDCPDTVAGTTVAGFLGQPHNVDAALARVEGRFSFVDTVLPPVGQLTGTDVTFPGDFVAKLGRTSGFTDGVVVSDTFTFKADYPVFGPVVLHDQLRIRNASAGDFGAPGDSGSIVINEDRQAVGLLIGGAPHRDGMDGVANPIGDVVQAFRLNAARRSLS